MREILTCGDCTRDFERLGIAPTKTYSGEEYDVHQLTDEQYNVLLEDMNEEIGFEDCGWRSSDGSSAVSADFEFTVNGVKLLGFSGAKYEDEDENDEDYYRWTEFPSLLTYMCEELGYSTYRNVTSVAVDLARVNGITMGELFTIYQGNK